MAYKTTLLLLQLCTIYCSQQLIFFYSQVKRLLVMSFATLPVHDRLIHPWHVNLILSGCGGCTTLWRTPAASSWRGTTTICPTCGGGMPSGMLSTPALQTTNTENSEQIFLEKELRGHSPNFHIHVCVWAIYIFPQSICIFCCRKYVDWS
jgi:hypothetical protein